MSIFYGPYPSLQSKYTKNEKGIWRCWTHQRWQKARVLKALLLAWGYITSSVFVLHNISVRSSRKSCGVCYKINMNRIKASRKIKIKIFSSKNKKINDHIKRTCALEPHWSLIFQHCPWTTLMVEMWTLQLSTLLVDISRLHLIRDGEDRQGCVNKWKYTRGFWFNTVEYWRWKWTTNFIPIFMEACLSRLYNPVSATFMFQ